MSHRGMIGSFGGRQKSGRLETSSVHGRANVARRKGWSRAGWGGHVTPRGRQCGTTSTREARCMAIDFRVLRHGSKGSSPKSAAPSMHADRPKRISDARAMSLSLSQLTSCVNSVLCTMQGRQAGRGYIQSRDGVPTVAVPLIANPEAHRGQGEGRVWMIGVSRRRFRCGLSTPRATPIPEARAMHQHTPNEAVLGDHGY